jgi:hypothetical protein
MQPENARKNNVELKLEQIQAGLGGIPKALGTD